MRKPSERDYARAIEYFQPSDLVELGVRCAQLGLSDEDRARVLALADDTSELQSEACIGSEQVCTLYDIGAKAEAVYCEADGDCDGIMPPSVTVWITLEGQEQTHLATLYMYSRVVTSWSAMRSFGLASRADAIEQALGSRAGA